MLDLIEELAAGRITLEEAEGELERQIERWRQGKIDDWGPALGVLFHEETAYLHGATLDALARLRRQGWPKACCRCGESIDYLKDIWMFRTDEQSNPLLVHLDCPKPPMPVPICPDTANSIDNQVNDDSVVRRKRLELERVLARLENGELDISQVLGFIEAAYEPALIEAAISAYQRVHPPWQPPVKPLSDS